VHRRQFLKLASGSVAAMAVTGRSFAQTSSMTLRRIADSKNLSVGSALSWPKLLNAEVAALIAAQCSIIVPENELKWGFTQPERDRYDFSKSDAMLAFAEAHGQRMRGHNLCWHEGNPKWLDATITSSNAAALLRQHIMVVAGHYRGKLHSWDVVNEAIDPRSGHPGGLRDSVWLKNLGDGYLDLAFRTAAEADPSALLTYNDYGIENDLPEENAKREAVLGLLRGMRSRGVPIHALGIQGHLLAHNDSPHFHYLHGFLKDLEKMNIQVFITELDVDDRELGGDVAKRDQRVAEIYRDFLKTALQYNNVRAVLTWGLTDRDVWINTFHPRADGLPKRPLPFDAKLQPKAAFQAMCEVMQEAPARSATPSS
jgi:endo-1,4-beta-xylanase